MANQTDYIVTHESDGGYKLTIIYAKRHWKPITAEGVFPKEKKTFILEIKGKGTNWSYRNQDGFYYSSSQVESDPKAWDFGYAWIDKDRKFIYINFYWISSPDKMIPSDVNGRYKLSANPGQSGNPADHENQLIFKQIQ